MVPLYMKCECGRQARYLTNMTETEFDVDCYDCGAPVAVEWNEKKWMYETMKEENRDYSRRRIRSCAWMCRTRWRRITRSAEGWHSREMMVRTAIPVVGGR